MCAPSSPHIAVGVNVAFFPTGHGDRSLSEVEDRKALRSIVSRRRTNTPGEYMGNDVSLANRRRFELAFESDCIRMKINTSTHARFKDREEVKRSQSLCLCETVQAVRSTTEGPTVPDAFVAEGTQLGDFLCLNLQRLKS